MNENILKQCEDGTHKIPEKWYKKDKYQILIKGKTETRNNNSSSITAGCSVNQKIPENIVIFRERKGNKVILEEIYKLEYITYDTTMESPPKKD